MVGNNNYINKLKVTPTQALPATQLAIKTRQTQNTSATKIKNKKQTYQEYKRDLYTLQQLEVQIQKSLVDIELIGREINRFHYAKVIAQHILQLLNVSLECALDKLNENVIILTAQEQESEQTQRRFAIELHKHEQKAKVLKAKLFPEVEGTVISTQQYTELTLKDALKNQTKLKESIKQLHKTRAKLLTELKALTVPFSVDKGKIANKVKPLDEKKVKQEKQVREKLKQLDIIIRKAYSDKKISNYNVQQEIAHKKSLEPIQTVVAESQIVNQTIQIAQELKQETKESLILEMQQVLQKQHLLKQEQNQLSITREALQKAVKTAKLQQTPNVQLMIVREQNLKQTITIQTANKEALRIAYKKRVEVENKLKIFKVGVRPTLKALERQVQHRNKLKKTAVKKLQAKVNKLGSKQVVLNKIPSRAFSIASKVFQVKSRKVIELTVKQNLRAKYLTKPKNTVYSKYKKNNNKQFTLKLKIPHIKKLIRSRISNFSKQRQVPLMALNNWEKQRLSTYDKLFYYFTVKTPMSLYAHKAFIMLEMQLNASLVRIRLVPYLFMVDELCFYRIIRVNNDTKTSQYYILSLYDNVTVPVMLHNYMYYRNYRVQFYPKLLAKFFKQYWLHFSNWNQNKVWLLTNFLVSNITAEAIVFDYPNIVSYISPFRRFTNLFYRNQQYTELAKSDEQYLTVSYSHTIIKLKLFSYTTYYR